MAHLKNLKTKPRKPRAERYVTRAELKEHLHGSTAEFRELKDYTHKSVHEIRDDMHTMSINMARILTILENKVPTLVPMSKDQPLFMTSKEKET